MVRGLGSRDVIEILDIALGVTVDDRQSLCGGVLGHEFAVLPAECFAKADGGMTTEVRQSFPFLFAHVIIVGQSGATDGRRPLLSADVGRVGGAHSVPNVVVITDGIERLAFGIVCATPKQLGVEDFLLDVGMYIELVGERVPYPLECGAVDRCLRLQIVQLGELCAEPVMVGEDQLGAVSHSRSQPPWRYALRPSCSMLTEAVNRLLGRDSCGRDGSNPGGQRWVVHGLGPRGGDSLGCNRP